MSSSRARPDAHLDDRRAIDARQHEGLAHGRREPGGLERRPVEVRGQGRRRPRSRHTRRPWRRQEPMAGFGPRPRRSDAVMGWDRTPRPLGLRVVRGQGASHLQGFGRDRIGRRRSDATKAEGPRQGSAPHGQRDATQDHDRAARRTGSPFVRPPTSPRTVVRTPSHERARAGIVGEESRRRLTA